MTLFILSDIIITHNYYNAFYNNADYNAFYKIEYYNADYNAFYKIEYYNA